MEQLCGPFWSDRLELRFLFVAQCRVEVLSRAAHQLDGLQMVSSRVAIAANRADGVTASSG
jgi:hypothetical protein